LVTYSESIYDISNEARLRGNLVRGKIPIVSIITLAAGILPINSWIVWKHN